MAKPSTDEVTQPTAPPVEGDAPKRRGRPRAPRTMAEAFSTAALATAPSAGKNGE